MKIYLLLSLFFLMCSSCGKNNSEHSLLLPPNNKDQQIEKIKKNKSNSTQKNHRPELIMTVSKATLGDHPLHFRKNHSYIKRIKKRIVDEDIFKERELEFYKHGLIENIDKDQILLAQFQEQKASQLSFDIEVSSKEHNIIKNINIDIYSVEADKMTFIDSISLLNNKEKNITTTLNLELTNKLLRAKSSIGFIITSFEFFKNGRPYLSKEYPQENKVFVIDDEVKTMSKSSFTQSQLYKFLPNTTDRLGSNEATKRVLGMWKKQENIYAYIRNQDLIFSTIHYFKIQTQERRYLLKEESATHRLKFIHSKPISLSGAIKVTPLKNDYPSNGLKCGHSSKHSDYVCWIKNQFYQVKFFEKACTFRQLKISYETINQLNTKLFHISDKDIKHSLIKDNSFYFSTHNKMPLTKESHLKKSLHSKVLQNNCNYKQCNRGETNCFTTPYPMNSLNHVEDKYFLKIDKR